MPEVRKELTELKWRRCPACAHRVAAAFSLLLRAKAGPRWTCTMQWPQTSGLRRQVAPWGFWGLLCQTTLLSCHQTHAPQHNSRVKSYHGIQHSCAILPSGWMCRCEGLPVYLCLHYGNLWSCVGNVFLGQDFWAGLIVLGTTSSLGTVIAQQECNDQLWPALHPRAGDRNAFVLPAAANWCRDIG